jgi:hypothetical protein
MGLSIIYKNTIRRFIVKLILAAAILGMAYWAYHAVLDVFLGYIETLKASLSDV